MGATGLFGQWGWGVESTPGTAVTVNKFCEIESANYDVEKQVVQGKGIKAGQTVPLSGRRYSGGTAYTGKVKVPVTTLGLGQLFRWAMGSSATAVVLGGTAYEQVHQPGDLEGTGHATTQQVVVPSPAGDKTYTYAGCKSAGFTLACETTGFATIEVDVDAMSESTITAKASASYTQGDLFLGRQLGCKLGGTVTTGSGKMAVSGNANFDGVTGFSLECPNPLNTERYYANASGTRAAALLNDFREWSITLERDFVDDTQYSNFTGDTAVPVYLLFTGAAISGGTGDGTNFKLEIILPAVKWDQAPHPLDGPDLQKQSLKGTILHDSTNGFLQLRYVNTETTI